MSGPIQHHTLAINGNELDVDVQGELDAPVILAHHGGPGISDRGELTRSFSALADRFRVITFDARGSGRSGGTPPFTHEQWVADLDALREWAGVQTFALAGHSYGGFVALEYAIRHPERLSALITIDTAAADTFRPNARARAHDSDRGEIDMVMFDRMFAGRVTDNDDFRAGWRAILPLYTVDVDSELVERIIESTVYRYETHNFAFSVNLPAYDVRARLTSITCPTLVIVGHHDWITPVAAAEQIVSGVPGAELVVFRASGHSPMLEEPELWVSTVRDFLERNIG